MALRKNDLEEAEALLERLKEEAPMQLVTMGLELEYLVKSGSLKEASVLGAELVRMFPDSSRVHHLMGDLAYREKRYKDAIASFRESFRQHPHWRSQYWLARALTQGGSLDEAQNILEALLPHHPFVIRDLAWVFERKGELERALSCYGQMMERESENTFVAQQIERIKGLLLDPEELVEELESLEDLGEEVPEHLLPDFVSNLFKTGQGARARELLSQRYQGMNPKLALKLGWSCYHAQAYDWAFDLWALCLEYNLHNYKFLNSFQASARKSGKLEELKELYESHAPKAAGLYGRLHKL